MFHNLKEKERLHLLSIQYKGAYLRLHAFLTPILAKHTINVLVMSLLLLILIKHTILGMFLLSPTVLVP